MSEFKAFRVGAATPEIEEPQSELERALIEEFLASKGMHLADLAKLPEAEVSHLMAEATTYTSLHLAEIDARAHLIQRLHHLDAADAMTMQR